MSVLKPVIPKNLDPLLVYYCTSMYIRSCDLLDLSFLCPIQPDVYFSVETSLRVFLFHITVLTVIDEVTDAPYSQVSANTGFIQFSRFSSECAMFRDNTPRTTAVGLRLQISHPRIIRVGVSRIKRSLFRVTHVSKIQYLRLMKGGDAVLWKVNKDFSPLKLFRGHIVLVILSLFKVKSEFKRFSLSPSNCSLVVILSEICWEISLVAYP